MPLGRQTDLQSMAGTSTVYVFKGQIFAFYGIRVCPVNEGIWDKNSLSVWDLFLAKTKRT